jgi:hypothetical protein
MRHASPRAAPIYDNSVGVPARPCRGLVPGWALSARGGADLVRSGLDCDPRQLRYLLAETESHLRDSAAVAQTSGLSAIEAEADAVARFGPALEVCPADRDRGRPSYGRLLRQSVWSVALLGGVGAAAVG